MKKVTALAFAVAAFFGAALATPASADPLGLCQRGTEPGLGTGGVEPLESIGGDGCLTPSDTPIP